MPALRILVAEDNPVMQLIVTQMLEQLHCDVVLAPNGEEAVIATNNDAFDAVLMDCRMPVMDGLTAARHIRSLHPHMPIIALTGNTDKDDRAECITAGMTDYLSKPINQNALALIIKNISGAKK